MSPLKTRFMAGGGLAALMAMVTGVSIASDPVYSAQPSRIPVDEQERIDAARAKRDRKRAARLRKDGKQ